MAKLYVVIDVGCHECGVSSEPVGAFVTLAEAEAAVEKRDAETGRWRNGGQTYAEVFEVEVPATVTAS